jgi:group I intron endonuclease
MIVYLITNLVNGKRYVGKTCKDLGVRWAQHQYHATVHRSGNILQAAIRKYGSINFKIEILEENLTEKEANLCEILYISFLNTRPPGGYNLTDGGEGKVGYKHSEATRAKMRISRKGGRPYLGHRHSEETRNKMSASRTGIYRSPEWCRHLSESLKGKRLTAGRRKHISEALTRYHQNKRAALKHESGQN